MKPHMETFDGLVDGNVLLVIPLAVDTLGNEQDQFEISLADLNLRFNGIPLPDAILKKKSEIARKTKLDRNAVGLFRLCLSNFFVVRIHLEEDHTLWLSKPGMMRNGFDEPENDLRSFRSNVLYIPALKMMTSEIGKNCKSVVQI